ERRTLCRKAERVAMGPLAASTPRRPARGHEPDGICPPFYVHQPGPRHDDCRHGQPGASAGQSRCAAAGTAGARPLRRCEAPSWRPRLGRAQRPAMIDDRDYVGYGADPPDPQWPGGARIAVNINLNFEGGGERSVMDGDGVSEGMLNDIGFPS